MTGTVTRPADQRTPDSPGESREARRIRRVIVIVAIILGVLMAGMVIWVLAGRTSQSDDAAGETALDPAIEALVADYYATANAYDRDAFGQLVTDDYTIFSTLEFSPAEGALQEVTRDEYLASLEGFRPLRQFTYERLGEPIMMGEASGPWHVAQAWRARSVTSGGTEMYQEGIGIMTVVDDDGALRVAREIGTPYQVSSPTIEPDQELSLTAEIEEVIATYFGAANTYDGEAFGALITDDYTIYKPYEILASSAPDRITTAAEFMAGFDGKFEFYELRYERLGEPLMMGDADGPWYVAQAWRLTIIDGDPIVTEGLAIITVVDDGGTLKVSRDLGLEYLVRTIE